MFDQLLSIVRFSVGSLLGYLLGIGCFLFRLGYLFWDWVPLFPICVVLFFCLAAILPFLNRRPVQIEYYSQQALPWFKKYFPVSSDFVDSRSWDILFFGENCEPNFTSPLLNSQWTSKTMGVKFTNCTLKKYFVTRTMEKVFFVPKHYKKVTDSISITNIDHLR